MTAEIRIEARPDDSQCRLFDTLTAISALGTLPSWWVIPPVLTELLLPHASLEEQEEM